MDLFTISELARFSGIKPHNIRMWERRYNALNPARSEGNTRYYSNSHLRRLLNIVSLMDSEYKVSELCLMPDDKLFKLVSKLQADTTFEGEKYFVSQLITAGINFDELHFEKIFSHSLLRFGMKDAYIKVVYPMLIRIGLMWSDDTIPTAQEHFISNLMRQKLFSAIDSLPPARPDGETWILFLPEDEFHEIGLLFAHYLIRLSGRKVFYLGSNVPVQSLVGAVKNTSASNLLFFLVHNDSKEELNKYLNELNSHFTSKKIFVAGKSHFLNQLKKKKNIYWLNSVEDLEQQLSA
ncbi:MAG: MerR family transcriptional regulator [Bacteroidota bacterium]|nr:MerR family transcriptional regulator [Bacteroidota bacterium]